MDIVSYILSKKYTDQTADAMGALKGAPCTVKSVTDITGGKRITLEWEGNSGNKETQSFDIMDGEDGKTITSVEINKQEHFIIYYSDGTSDDAGTIDINSAVTSVNGQTGDVSLTASDVGALPDNTSIPANTSDLNNDSGFIDNTVDDLVNYTLSSSLANVATSGNYSDLSGTPTIPMATSDLNNDSNFVSDANYVHTDNNFTDAASTKLAGIASGAEVNVQSDWNETDNSSDTYIANKPTIPTKVSDLANDTGFITSTVNNLANYYLKTQTYTQAEVNALISAISTITISVVQTLPTTDIQTNVIYLTPKPSAQTNNVYDEYVNTTGTTAGWEKIGDTEIDLSNYVTTTALNTALADYTTTVDLTTLLAAKADASTVNAILDGQNIDSFADVETALSGKVDKEVGKGLSTNDYTTAEKTKLAGIEAGAEVNPTSSAKTATDTFTTVNGGLLSKCMIDLEPIQDLHGYDSPWVGGAGKNLVYIENGTIISDATKANQTNRCRTGNMNYLDANTDYVISASTSISGKTVQISYQTWTSDDFGGNTRTFDSGWQNIPKVINLTSGAWFTFVLRYSNDSLISSDELTVQLEKGSSPTDYEPYENICPISGHTEVDLYNVGKNLYNGLSEIGSWVKQRCTATFNGDGSITVTNTQSGATWIGYFGTVGTTVNINNCPCSKGDSLIITSGNNTVCNSIMVGEIDSSNTLLKITIIASGATYTVTEDDTTAIVLRYALDLSDGASVTIYPMIRKSTDTDSTFEPYNPSSHLYQVQIGSTVYGGYVDLVSGELRITHGYVDLGTLTWSRASTSTTGKYRFNATHTPLPKPVATNADIPDLISSNYIAISPDNSYLNVTGVTITTGGSIYIYDEALSAVTASDFKTAMNGVQLVYELATPLTIQLTPQQLIALVGQNNLSAPLTSQEVISTTYEQIASFNAVLDDVNQSSESTYSSEKIEESYVGKDDIETKSATDSFVTTNGGLLSKCVVDFVPVQSGSGDPYPAGGGKNKLENTATSTTINNVTFTVNPDGSVLVNTTGATATTLFTLNRFNDMNLSDGTYAFNGCPSGGSVSTYYLQVTKSPAPSIVDTGNGNTFVIGGDYSVINIRIVVENGAVVNNALFKPMIRLSTVTDPTFAPYSNVRPISGHTEVDLYNVGKNRLDPTNAFGSFSGYTINTDGSVTVTEADGRTWDNIAPIPLKAGTYTLSRDVTVGRTAVRTSDNNYGSDIIIFEGRTSISFTLAQDGGIKVKANYSGTYPITIKFQLEKGNQATTFEPYLGHLYQVQIGSTVYGGYVDLVSGVMTATYALVTYVGTENWGVNSGTRIYYLSLPSDYKVDNTILANKYKGVSPRNNTNLSNNECALSTTYTYLNVRDENATSTSDFKTKLSQTNLEVLYKLATPQTIQLTPQQIETLAGQNNLSTPLNGQSIETNGVEYKELFTFADVVNRVDVKAGTGEESVVMNHINGNYTNTASGRWSTATGYNSTSSGDFSYTEGYGCIASALYTHAEGIGNQATSRASHAEGDTNKAIANSAHAEGYDTIAGYYNESTQTYTGASSHAEGISTRTYGNGSHAEGWQSRAEAIYSHAEGEITVASAEAAHTEGIQTTASGYAAHAEGKEAIAIGAESHAGGYKTSVNGQRAFTHGYLTTATNNDEVVFGVANSEVLSTTDPTAYTVFAIGNGTVVDDAATVRSNVFEIRSNGAVLANNSKLISVSELQTIVASCTDFSDFKAAIAAL